MSIFHRIAKVYKKVNRVTMKDIFGSSLDPVIVPVKDAGGVLAKGVHKGSRWILSLIGIRREK